MQLSNEDRGMLERLFDDTILRVPDLARAFRKGQQRLHLRDPDDATVGCVWGYIIALFSSKMDARLTEEIMGEASNIIFNRSDEIRNKIHDAG